METDDELILGILGGMGPMAGVEFQRRIINKVPAKTDQGHIQMVCFTNSKIQDRTKGLAKGIDFAAEVAQSLNLMKKFHVNLGVMTCNTAHASFEKIAGQVDFPLLNIIQETVNCIVKKHPFIGNVGLLATDGTLRSQVYATALKEKGLGMIIPQKTDQREVMEIIYGKSGIKSGCINSNRVKVLNLIKNLENSGADVVVLGCTELSLLGIEGGNIIDPLDVAVEAVLRKRIKAE